MAKPNKFYRNPKIARLVAFAQKGRLEAYERALKTLPPDLAKKVKEIAGIEPPSDDLWWSFNAFGAPLELVNDMLRKLAAL